MQKGPRGIPARGVLFMSKIYAFASVFFFAPVR